MSDKMQFIKIGHVSITLFFLLGLAGCSSQVAEVLNPFAEEAPIEYGERSNKAILEDGTGGSGAEAARRNLNVLGKYRRAQEPQPYYPVIRPAEVRLMWVPDHVNRAGDLVPAHYYYLRVLDDIWELQDAFDMSEQINKGSSSGGSAVPWVYSGD